MHSLSIPIQCGCTILIISMIGCNCSLYLWATTVLHITFLFWIFRKLLHFDGRTTKTTVTVTGGWRMGVFCIAFIVQLFFLWPQCASFIYLHLKFINVFSPSIFHLSLFVAFLNSWRVPIGMKLTSKNMRATLSIYIFSALHFANHKTSQHWFLCLLLLLLVQWFGRLRLKSI